MSRYGDQSENLSNDEPSSQATNKEEFAARLRKLRSESGSPSFRHLAKITNYSPSTLAEATSGRRLPTGPVVKALVAACGADPTPWLEELRQLSVPAASPVPAVSGTEPPADLAARGAVRWRAIGLTAGTLALFGTGLGVGLMSAPAVFRSDAQVALSQEAGPGVPPFAGTPTPAPTARVADGTDPGVGHCHGDVRLIDKAPVMRGSVQIGALELLYSPRCGAGWAMIFLYPGEPTMMGEVTVRAGDGRYSTFADPLVRQIDDYTDVIVPGRNGCLGAYGQVYQAGLPVVTAFVPCQAPGAS
jgi:Protein of unknown function (DUF2690)/Helix-turn-helix domain